MKKTNKNKMTKYKKIKITQIYKQVEKNYKR